MRVLGIDLGSREVKAALMNNGCIERKFKISTMAFYKDFCSYNERLTVDLSRLDVDEKSIDCCVSTGYGRNNTDIQYFRPINEIKAHVYGAIYQTGFSDFILLDIGGQDVKVARVEKGIVTDLELNDKCAASCGRYLENMANILEVTVDEMSEYYLDPVELNSTCAVFSESELIGKIAQGVDIERLYAGVNYSLYKRLLPLLTRFKGRRLLLSGGAALNNALRKYLNNDYEDVCLLTDPQFNGAIGCCSYGEIAKKMNGEE